MIFTSFIFATANAYHLLCLLFVRQHKHWPDLFGFQTVADAFDDIDDIVNLHIGDDDVRQQHRHGMDGIMNMPACVKVGGAVIQIMNKTALRLRNPFCQPGGKEKAPAPRRQ